MSEFVTAISMALQPVAFSPMEVVLKVGYRNNRMFIIQKGIAGSGKAGRVLGAG